ncbi:hypothetical protein BV25DRAFT_1821511 [Artomyces pyxidatus]|uniref:Uncharacterized protein n=1 Tax=Artomyces pyxidatus TaxID=48021 RepID=A0ACB8TB99_9AGAM|nr:hypothetical protein BV25DRAFT_1821511 [Artomyces pyxidatus]
MYTLTLYDGIARVFPSLHWLVLAPGNANGHPMILLVPFLQKVDPVRRKYAFISGVLVCGALYVHDIYGLSKPPWTHTKTFASKGCKATAQW